MSALYLDCYSGVAGDMILAALLDLGVDRDGWLKALNRLPLRGFKIQFERVMRREFSSLQVQIAIEEPQPERHLSDIVQVIQEGDLSAEVKERAKKVFTCLAEAEAKIHGTDIQKVHFHEVGASDAIIDVVGTCLALESLGADKIYSTPVGLGRGLSRSAHGPMPLPPPATLEILRGAPVRFHEVETELATPTGAALLKSLAEFVPPPAEMVVTAIGYGAGSKIIPELPNVLRALLLEGRWELESDRAVLLETNIDDMNPEVFPHAISKLLEAGAMDAYLVPIIMKKGRPGVILSTLCSLDLKQKIVDLIYSETSTLGIRAVIVDRLKLLRREIVVATPLGPIKGKEARWENNVRRTPEFEDCRRIAEEKGVPLQEVYRIFHRTVEETSSDG